MAYSCSCSYLICLPSRSPAIAGRRRSHHRNKHIGDARPANFAKRYELFAIDPIEQQNAAAEDRSLMNRIESAGGGELLRTDRDFHVARFEFFHAAFEHDPTTIDEHDVGQHVLNFFDLMCGHDDGAAAIELII